MRLGDFRFQTDHYNHPLGKVILVGMLEDGPTGRGFTFHNHNKLFTLLGDNSMTRTWRYLVDNGIRSDNILFYRLNGLPSRLDLVDDQETPLLGFRSMNSHELEENVHVRVNAEGLTLYSSYDADVIAEGRRRDFVRTYRFADFLIEDEPDLLSLDRLTEAITEDALLGLHPIVAQAYLSHLPLAEFTVAVNKYNLSEQSMHAADSESGLCRTKDAYTTETVEDYWVRFKQYVLGPDYDGEALTPLINHQAELLYFPDFAAEEDSRVPRLAAQVALQKTREQHILCTAVFGTRPVPPVQTLGDDEYMTGPDTYFSTRTYQEEPWLPKAEQDAFLARLNTLFREHDRASQAMQHLTVTVGDDARGTSQLSSGAHFVHLLLTRRPGTPLTNQALADFVKINAELPKVAIAELSANGYICSVPSIRRGTVLTEVKHLQHPAAYGYMPYATRRLVSYIEHDLTRLLDRYIGNSHSLFNQAGVQEDITHYFDQHLRSGTIARYDLDVTGPETPTDHARIQLTLHLFGDIVSLNSRLTLDEEEEVSDLWTLTTS